MKHIILALALFSSTGCAALSSLSAKQLDSRLQDLASAVEQACSTVDLKECERAKAELDRAQWVSGKSLEVVDAALEAYRAAKAAVKETKR